MTEEHYQQIVNESIARLIELVIATSKDRGDAAIAKTLEEIFEKVLRNFTSEPEEAA